MNGLNRGSPDKKSGCGCLTILLILFIIGLIIALIINNNRLSKLNDELLLKKEAISSLISKTDEYAAMEGTADKREPKKPCKMFVIQNEQTDANEVKPAEITYYVSDYNFSLPEELQAKTPDELNTLVRMYFEEKETGYYTVKDRAYTQYLQITVIDTATGDIIDEAFLEGPPDMFLDRVDEKKAHGKVLAARIEKYLKDLAGYSKSETVSSGQETQAGAN